MNWGDRENRIIVLVLATMLLLLPLLATLQYRWLAQLSEREREHMRANLRATTLRFTRDVETELSGVLQAFRPGWVSDPARDAAMRQTELAAARQRWSAGANYPALVGACYVARADEAGALALSELDPQSGRLEPREWPAGLAHWRESMERERRAGHMSQVGRLRGQPLQETGAGTMAFVYPLLIPALPDRDQGKPPLPLGYVIVTISPAVLWNEMMPALAARHFAGEAESSYNATIVAPANPRAALFQYGPEAGGADHADIVIGLPDLRAEDHGPGRGRPPGPPPGMRAPGPRGWPGRGPDRPRFEERDNAGGSGIWQLRLTHQAGSLDAAVGEIRRRNLLISFGILALLGASVGVTLYAARRAQRLASQQMDFVAGVSHELRTPLAVIKSAAWTLGRGVARDPEQIARYSGLIGRESDRLTAMIEQILAFAGAESGRETWNLQPVGVTELIETALADAQLQLVEGGFELKRNIPADLPRVMADARAFGHALRNLLENAMKYSGGDHRIEVEARAVVQAGRAEAHIIVRDHGIGIQVADQKHIFKPFWRAAAAQAAQIRGNGLGLSLVSRIVRAHGGRILVESAPGRGSAFTLTLPVLAETSAGGEMAHGIHGRGTTV
ncbi:MAG: sensor histidine kinase [Blastocatellia bacterium]